MVVGVDMFFEMYLVKGFCLGVIKVGIKKLD